MEGRYSDEELLWISDVLDQHGKYLQDLLSEAIAQKKLIRTAELEQRISYKAQNYGANPALAISFLGYGRAIEIRYHKSQNTNSLLSPGVNAILMAARGKKKQFKKKDTRWYARNVYGSLNRLISILSYEFTDHERARIKGIFEAQKNRTS